MCFSLFTRSASACEISDRLNSSNKKGLPQQPFRGDDLAGQIIKEFLYPVKEAFRARAVVFARWAAKALLQVF